jgi:hypothetical protein
MAATVFNYDPNNMPTNASPLTVVPLLAGCDTIHDIKEEPGGRVTTLAWHGGVYDAHLNHLNGLIDAGVLPTLAQGGGGATEWLSAASGRSITASSSVEHQTVAAFENIFPIELNKNLTVKTTYRAILVAITMYTARGDDINLAIYNAGNYIVRLNNILDVEVAPGEIFEAAYSAIDKIYIALFMLNFFFPPSPGDTAYNSRLPTYMTFDAGSHIPNKLFGPLDQVVNLVTPLNIADSSTASSHLLAGKKGRKNGVKNKYEFPEQPGAIGGGYNYTSNISTFSNFRFQIPRAQGQTYTETTKYDFTIDLYRLQPQSRVSRIQFNAQHINGPSLPYLADLIGNQMPVAGNKMANLTQLMTDLTNMGIATNDILLDIKRGGDWEQCNAAHIINNNSSHNSTGRVILCTLDQLCALYSRCLGQNTILHYNTRLTLYRFISAANPEILRAQEAAVAEARRVEAAGLEASRRQAFVAKTELVNAIVLALVECEGNIRNIFIPEIRPDGEGVVYIIIAWIKRQLLTVLQNTIQIILSLPKEPEENLQANEENLQAYVNAIELWLGVDLTIGTVEKIVDSIRNFNPLAAGKGAQKLGEYNVTALMETAKPMMQKLLLENGGFGRRRIAGNAALDEISNELLDVLKGYLLTIKDLVLDVPNTEISAALNQLAGYPVPAELSYDNNVAYIRSLQGQINAFDRVARGGRTKVQGAPKKSFKGGALTEAQRENAIRDCSNEIVTNFVELCANISERFGVIVNFDLHGLLTSYGHGTIDIPREDLSIVTILLDFFKETYSVMANTDELLEQHGKFLANAPGYIFIYAMVSFIYFDYEAFFSTDPPSPFRPLFVTMFNGTAPTGMDEVTSVFQFFLYVMENFNWLEFLPGGGIKAPVDHTNYITHVINGMEDGTYVPMFISVIQLLYKVDDNGVPSRTPITPNGLIIRLFVFLKNYLQFVVEKVARRKAETVGYYNKSDFGYNEILLTGFWGEDDDDDDDSDDEENENAAAKPPNYKTLFHSLNRIVAVDTRNLTVEYDNFKKIYDNSGVILLGLLYAIRKNGNPSRFANSLARLLGESKISSKPKPKSELTRKRKTNSKHKTKPTSERKGGGKKTVKKHKTKLSKNKKKKNNKRRRTIKV